jgi:hypothetical protein
VTTPNVERGLRLVTEDEATCGVCRAIVEREQQ